MILQTGRAQKIQDLTHITVDEMDFAVVKLIESLDSFLVAQHCQALGRCTCDIVTRVMKIRISVRPKDIILGRRIIWRVRFKKVKVKEEVFGFMPIEPLQCESC